MIFLWTDISAHNRLTKILIVFVTYNITGYMFELQYFNNAIL